MANFSEVPPRIFLKDTVLKKFYSLCFIVWVSQPSRSALPNIKFFWPNRIFYFLSFPVFSISIAKHKILLAESYILFFDRIIFLKKRGRKKNWWPNTIFWNCMIRPVVESNKKKCIIRPVAESNKKKCLIRPKLLAESYRYHFSTCLVRLIVLILNTV